SGKSTLIRILATLLTPDAGTASVFGYDVVRHPAQVRRHINRVSVEASFFKEMSPWENMLYAARLYGSGGDGTRDRVEAMLDRLEAEVLCDRVLVIDQGRVLAEGAPAELVRSHADVGGSLEDAFMRLTGKRLEEDEEEKEE